MRPLAIAVVGGLSVSTLLTLFVVPCLYVILHTFAASAARRSCWASGAGGVRAPMPQPVAGD